MTYKKPPAHLKNQSGFGATNAKIQVYIENTPPLPEYQELSLIKPLEVNDVARIGQLTGNHWRKIFNVFAKLLFEYSPNNFTTWQSLRDEYLLQVQSNEQLIFSPISYEEIITKKDDQSYNVISLIMGKTYANKLGIDEYCYWLSESFAINTKKRIIICPYFDYRQLSNIKITQLVQLIKQLEA